MRIKRWAVTISLAVLGVCLLWIAHRIEQRALTLQALGVIAIAVPSHLHGPFSSEKPPSGLTICLLITSLALLAGSAYV